MEREQKRVSEKERDPHEHLWGATQPLLQLGDNVEDCLCNPHYLEHLAIFGSSGASKTTGSFYHYLFSVLSAGYAAVIPTAKPGDGSKLESLCFAAGRGNDLIRMTLRCEHSFDPMAYIAAHPNGSNIEDIIEIPSLAMEVLQPGSRPGEEYWEGGKLGLLRDLGTPLAATGKRVSLSSMEELLMDAPQSGEEVRDPAWQKGPLCRLLDEAVSLDLDDVQKGDIERCAKNWLKAWPKTPSKSRGVFEQSVRGLSDRLLRGPTRRLVSSGTFSVCPELLDHGAILILDFPSLAGPTNVAVQTMILTAFCNRLKERVSKPGEVLRPIAVAIDEAQKTLTTQTAEWLQVLRGSAVSICLCSQDLQGYYKKLGGDSEARTAVDNIMSNCATKIFHSISDPDTQDFASRLIGNETKIRGNFGGTFSGRGSQMSAGGMEEEKPIVDPSYFGIGLRRGGEANDFVTDAIIFQNSRIWRATGKPFIKASFRQMFF